MGGAESLSYFRMSTTMLKAIEGNDAIEVTDGSEEDSTLTKIVWSVLGIVGMTIVFSGLGYFLLLAYAGWLWYQWRPYRATSYLFDRKTLMVYRVETKKKQRHLKELAHFSELVKFEIIKEEEPESAGRDDMGDTGDMGFFSSSD
jgi:hypothetical protein